MAHTPTPAHPHPAASPTPLWLGWVIDSTELDVRRWAAVRELGRRRYVWRARALAWATALGCLAWQLAIVRRQGGGITDLVSAGDPALLSLGALLLALVYGVSGLQWWVRERKFRREVRRRGAKLRLGEIE
jgi:hypothetical protein